MQFDVDYNHTNTLQGLVVPPRLLTDNDTAPHIPDFTPAENRALLASQLLYAANKDSHGHVLGLFRRLCCSPRGRYELELTVQCQFPFQCYRVNHSNLKIFSRE